MAQSLVSPSFSPSLPQQPPLVSHPTSTPFFSSTSLMAAKGRAHLLFVAFSFVLVLNLALWARSSTFRFSSPWSLSVGPSLNADVEGAGGGIGTGEVEWEEGWAKEKEELQKIGELELIEEEAEASSSTKGTPSFASVAWSGRPCKSARTDLSFFPLLAASPISISVASPTTDLSTHPSLAPVPPHQLSLLRKDYLARIASMSDFNPDVVNVTHNERMLLKLQRCLKEGEEGRGRCATEIPKVSSRLSSAAFLQGSELNYAHICRLLSSRNSTSPVASTSEFASPPPISSLFLRSRGLQILNSVFCAPTT